MWKLSAVRFFDALSMIQPPPNLPLSVPQIPRPRPPQAEAEDEAPAAEEQVEDQEAPTPIAQGLPYSITLF